MREIAFRAWDKEKKEILEVVSLVFLLTGEVAGVGCVGRLQNEEDPERYELMQYTGLKDKNGKKIWEGDVVRYHNWYENMPKPEFVVKFDVGGFCPFNNPLYLDWTGEAEELTEEDVSGEFGFEVIGNIYENEELLNK